MQGRQRLTNVVLVLAVLSGQVGCAVTVPLRRTALQTWIGRHYESVLTANGRPIEVYGDGLSGRVLVYASVSPSPAIPSTGAIPRDSADVFEGIVWGGPLVDRTVPTHVAQSMDLLYVDKDGYVYSFQTNAGDRAVREDWERNALVAGGVAVLLGLVVLLASMESGYQ